MTEKSNPGGSSSTRKKYTPAFRAECVRRVAAGARQSDVARAQGISPVLLGRWQRQALAAAVPSSAEGEEVKQLRAALKRVEMERDILKHPRSPGCSEGEGASCGVYWSRQLPARTGTFPSP